MSASDLSSGSGDAPELVHPSTSRAYEQMMTFAGRLAAVPSLDWTHRIPVSRREVPATTEVRATIDGESFGVEHVGDLVMLVHPQWSLGGMGATLADAGRHLQSEAVDLLRALDSDIIEPERAHRAESADDVDRAACDVSMERECAMEWVGGLAPEADQPVGLDDVAMDSSVDTVIDPVMEPAMGAVMDAVMAQPSVITNVVDARLAFLARCMVLSPTAIHRLTNAVAAALPSGALLICGTRFTVSVDAGLDAGAPSDVGNSRDGGQVARKIWLSTDGDFAFDGVGATPAEAADDLLDEEIQSAWQAYPSETQDAARAAVRVPVSDLLRFAVAVGASSSPDWVSVRRAAFASLTGAAWPTFPIIETGFHVERVIDLEAGGGEVVVRPARESWPISGRGSTVTAALLDLQRVARAMVVVASVEERFALSEEMARIGRPHRRRPWRPSLDESVKARFVGGLRKGRESAVAHPLVAAWIASSDPLSVEVAQLIAPSMGYTGEGDGRFNPMALVTEDIEFLERGVVVPPAQAIYEVHAATGEWMGTFVVGRSTDAAHAAAIAVAYDAKHDEADDPRGWCHVVTAILWTP